MKSGGLGPLSPSPRDKRTRAAAHSPLSSLRCHGARSVSASSQQLPRRPVPGPRDPSWDSPASLCPSARGGEEVPASAHSDQQVQWGDGAEEGLVVEGGGSVLDKPEACRRPILCPLPWATGIFFERRSCGQPLYPLSPTPSLSSAVLLQRPPFLGGPPVQGGCSLETPAAPM